MKIACVILIVVMVSLFGTHRLLGSWLFEPQEHIPIENHLSSRDIQHLSQIIDDNLFPRGSKDGESWLVYFQSVMDVFSSDRLGS